MNNFLIFAEVTLILSLNVSWMNSSRSQGLIPVVSVWLT